MSGICSAHKGHDPKCRQCNSFEVPHPIQPLYIDDENVLRFKLNPIVRYLLDNGTIDINMIVRHGFSDSDLEHFAQLIGYSLSGSSELPYMSDETWETANNMAQNGETQMEANNRFLRDTLKSMRKHVKRLASGLFRIHPDDLHE